MVVINLAGKNFQVQEEYLVRNAKNPNALGYGQAMQYYKSSKNTLKRDLETALRKQFPQLAKSTIENKRRALMRELTNSNSTADTEAQKDLADKLLETVRQEFNNTNSDSYRGLLENIYQKMKDKEKDSKASFKYTDFDSMYFTKVKQALNELEKDVNSDLGKRLQSLTTGKSAEVRAQIISYFASLAVSARQHGYSIGKQVPGFQKAEKNYTNALKGYHREEALTKSYAKLFEDLYRVTPDFSNKVIRNIGGQNVKEDILIDIKTLLESAEKLNGKEYSGSSEVEEGEILPAANVQESRFGIQAKSFNLEQPNKDFYSLGTSADLQRNLLSNVLPNKRKQAGRTMLGNMLYMGQADSIQSALGKDNVIFVDGYKKYWMQDFIESFRKKGLWLSLSARGADWKRDVTSQIVLYAYKQAKHKA